MKLATRAADGPDGRLVVVSSDGARCLTPDAPMTLQQALDSWDACAPQLLALNERVKKGEGEAVMPRDFAAPLPRAWQWLDGSAFDTHGVLMQKAFDLPPIETDKPLMYQGMSHVFYGPVADVPFVSEADGIDFEGEYGVIVDDVPMGTSAPDAMRHIKLLVQINDWSLRTLAPKEMKTGFGWVQAKPACSVAPLAVTPDELGAAWSDGRVHLPLEVRLNGAPFGRANGAAMSVGFHDLIAHAAATRDLCAGTIIGSGTVSNDNYRDVGSSCISERRAIEMIEADKPVTPFMSFGDSIFMEARTVDGDVLFGAIDQQVVAAGR
ncbi:MAG: fumarylacetoacetate hydrolase family protein [Gammaproteobacteria bacterium]